MNYSDIITMYANGTGSSQRGYLCSGEDAFIANCILNDIVHLATGSIVVIDDSGVMREQVIKNLYHCGYTTINGLEQKLCYQDILDITNISGISRIRTLLSITGFDEMQIQKIIAYLSFIKHVEMLAGNEGKVSLEVLTKYSTNIEVKKYLDNLTISGQISNMEQLYLLSKYSEIASAVADFENILIIMGQFITGNITVKKVLQNAKQALYIPLYMLGRDICMKKLLMEMITLVISDKGTMCKDIIVLDNGREQSNYLSEFLQGIQYLNKKVHVISQDIFLADERFRQIIMCSTDIRVYSRHSNMDSCEEIEKLLGSMDIVKQTYSVDYSRQWKTNSAWDMLLGNNKVEHYNWNAPVREPKCRKEDIHTFSQYVGIIEVNGNSSIFNCAN